MRSKGFVIGAGPIALASIAIAFFLTVTSWGGAVAETQPQQIVLLREGFEYPDFCSEPWDQDHKELWVRGDSNPGSGADYWCHTRNGPDGGRAYSGNFSGWCAVKGNNSIASEKEGKDVLDRDIMRYDTNMSAYIRHSLSPSPALGAPVLEFYYWSKTGDSNATALNDFLAVSVSSDGEHFVQVWRQPEARDDFWQKVTVVLPNDTRTLSFDFFSGPTLPDGLQPGAYIDDILVTQSGTVDSTPSDPVDQGSTDNGTANSTLSSKPFDSLVALLAGFAVLAGIASVAVVLYKRNR